MTLSIATSSAQHMKMKAQPLQLQYQPNTHQRTAQAFENGDASRHHAAVMAFLGIINNLTETIHPSLLAPPNQIESGKLTQGTPMKQGEPMSPINPPLGHRSAYLSENSISTCAQQTI
jgi:hypothetical protein